MSNPITPVARFAQSSSANGKQVFQLTAFGHESTLTDSGGGTDVFQMIVVHGIAPVPDGMWPVFEMLQGTDPNVLPLRIVFVRQVSTPPLNSNVGKRIRSSGI